MDSNLPSIESILSVPQSPIILHWLEGIYQYTFSLPVDKFSQQFSPLTETNFQIDSNTLKSLKWSLDLLKENLVRSYLFSLPYIEHEQYSLPATFHLNFSTNELNNEQIFSITDSLF